MSEIYLLAFTFCLTAILAVFVRRLGQPMVVAYILSGIFLASFGLNKSEYAHFIKFLPEVGLAFLLFLVGMELDLRQLRALGKNIVIAFACQLIVGTAFISGLLLNLPLTNLFILGSGLTFSSTILVVKLLLESKELSSLHGRLAVGILLLEDFAAMALLLFLAAFSNQEGVSLMGLLLIFLKGAFLVWLSLFSGKKILPYLGRLFAENTELLILCAISWCFIFSALAVSFGFSLGIGAFLAGVSVAQSIYRISISGRIKPLRDFFIMIFFVDLGMGLSLSAMWQMPYLIIGLIVYVLFIKPAVFFFLLSFVHFRAKTAFQTSALLTSVSEFSLIVMAAAEKMGLINSEIISAVTFATIITFICSTIIIKHQHAIYLRLRKTLKLAERGKVVHLDFLPGEPVSFSNHAVLIGCDQSGSIILSHIKKTFEDNVLVVDFNPEVIENLRSERIPCIYGDISDPEIMEKLNLKEAKLVISTIRDLHGNLSLLEMIVKMHSSAIIIMTAAEAKEAIVLYERGAHYVSLPVNLEGHAINRMIADYSHSIDELYHMKEKKLGELKKMAADDRFHALMTHHSR